MNEQIAQLCRRAIESRVFPGCQLAYVRGGKRIVREFGHLTYAPDARGVSAATLYDVASATKSVATGSLILKLAEEGRLGLDDLAIKYVPELTTRYRDQLTIRHLLTYTVVFDLPDGVSALVKRDPGRVREALLESELVAAPGEKYFYTNGPAVVLGLIAERVYGEPLDVAARRVLFEPLGLASLTFEPTQEDAAVAPTAVIDGKDWVGEVQDESARAMRAAGQRSGAAGLFATAGDLLRYAEMLLAGGELDGVRLFQPETVGQMHTNQIASLGASTGLGWELNWPLIMGHNASPQTFGKTGFTGCLILIDPAKQAALVHLSNRTYPNPSPNRDAINAFRRELADIIFE